MKHATVGPVTGTGFLPLPLCGLVISSYTQQQVFFGCTPLCDATVNTNAVIPTQHCSICQPMLHVPVQRTVITHQFNASLMTVRCTGTCCSVVLVSLHLYATATCALLCLVLHGSTPPVLLYGISIVREVRDCSF